MRRANRLYRTTVATPLAVVLLALSVAVPVMERADLTHVPVVESEHEPGSCPTPHDHTICTQVSANHAAPGGDSAVRSIEVARHAPGVTGAGDLRENRFSPPVSARAPPRA
jgi:hypothetical protein